MRALTSASNEPATAVKAPGVPGVIGEIGRALVRRRAASVLALALLATACFQGTCLSLLFRRKPSQVRVPETTLIRPFMTEN